jgi:predicted phosphoribosyltransferase
MFQDRKDAAQQLVLALKKYKNSRDAIVLSVPRGGVVPGDIVARKLNIPMETPAKIVVAVPVGSSEAVEAIKAMADEVVCLEIYDHFHAVGMYYRQFNEVTDAEVIRILEHNHGTTSNG